jgi:hypothetical protein
MLEAVLELAVLHIVEIVHPLLELVHPDGQLGEECLGGELLELLILDPTDEEVLLNVDEGILEVIGEIISEELLEEEGLHPGEDIDTTLLAIERLELRVVSRFVPLLLHTPKT